MKTIILNIFSRILKLCRCVFLLDVYLFYVLMYVLQEIFPPWHIPFKRVGQNPKMETYSFSLYSINDALSSCAKDPREKVFSLRGNRV